MGLETANSYLSSLTAGSRIGVNGPGENQEVEV